jgi:FeS assembly SUF system protein
MCQADVDESFRRLREHAMEPTPAPPLPLEEQVIAALKSCYDPEIPVNIYELGLIYAVDIDAAGAVAVRMTLTSPACPAATSLPPEVQRKVAAVPGVTAAKVDVVWDPPWEMSRMSEAARLQLGLFD